MAVHARTTRLRWPRRANRGPRADKLCGGAPPLLGRATPSEVPMIAIMWQFDVKAGHETEFEQLYGADGAWTAMNRHTRSYLGSSFLNDQNRALRYILIEYWSEMVVSEPARGVRAAAVAAFEAQRTALIESIQPMGVFTALNVPDRFGPTWSQRQ